MIAIVDYGMGNLRSVNKAFESMGFASVVTGDINTIKNSEGLVLPGVGAFGDCVKNLKHKKLVTTIIDYIAEDKPFLGICLGLQVLFEGSEESPGTQGLGIIKGKVVKFQFPEQQKLKVPHMGWNQINIVKNSDLLYGIAPNSWFYFVHSYYAIPDDDDFTAITSIYGFEFTAAIQKRNLFACQFHPEKSSDAGLRLLKNFALKCGKSANKRAV
jgi:imidazole glycerol-phosphate synthase subunit HisH